MTPPKKKILVVEDHPIFRLGLRELINQEADLVVCGEAKDAHAAWQAVQDLAPDLVIADITLEDGDGIELTKQIKRHFRDLPVLILSMHDEFLYAERALHAGARGYIMKQEAMESVVTAARQVLAGKIYLNDRMKEHILANLSLSRQDRDLSPMARLTDRELEVFSLIGQGLSTRAIAERLNLSIKTIGTHRERIKVKLRLKNANELLRHAVNWRRTGQSNGTDIDM
jgi:DNA-binding NarL/FixJ family response regulator